MESSSYYSVSYCILFRLIIMAHLRNYFFCILPTGVHYRKTKHIFLSFALEYYFNKLPCHCFIRNQQTGLETLRRDAIEILEHVRVFAVNNPYAGKCAPNFSRGFLSSPRK